MPANGRTTNRMVAKRTRAYLGPMTWTRSLVRPVAWLLAGAAGAAVSLAPSPATACGACGCFIPYGVRPSNLRDDAPLNTRLLLALRGTDAGGRPQTIDPGDITWTDADGAPIAFEIVTTDGSGEEVWLQPLSDLPANTEFELQVIDSNGASTHMFGTGDLVDHTPPEADAPTVTPITASSACGAFYGARITWPEIRDDHEPITYDPIVRLDIELGTQSTVLLTSTSEMYPGRGIELASPGDHESGACWEHLALPFGIAGDTLTVTATIYDAAGNPLELEPFDVTLGDSPGATCPDGSDGSSDGGSEGGGMCSVVVPGLGGRWGAGWWGLMVMGGLAAMILYRKCPTRASVHRSNR